MTSKQESRLSMYLTVHDFLNANGTITATLPNYTAVFGALQTGITQIQSIRAQQELNKTGIAVNKGKLRDNLIALALDVSRKVIAYASYVNNTVLLKEVHYTQSDMKRKADTIVKDMCQVIYDKANANAAALVLYGVTATLLANLKQAIMLYNNAIPTPKLGIIDKKKATSQLVTLFNSTDDALYKMDRVVDTVKLSQPVFYNGYRNARKLVETGTGSLTLKGKVIDAANGKGLIGATVAIITAEANGIAKMDKDANIVKKTAGKGGFNVKTLAKGSYTVKVSKVGYKDKVVKVHVNNGELSVLDVALEQE